jgi:hypothetical protein
MNPTPAAVCANDELVDRYEELRRQALDPSAGIYRGPGLALLIHRGMRAWMEVSSCSSTTPCTTSRRVSNREGVLISEQHSEIVSVLTTMALHHYPETYQ